MDIFKQVVPAKATPYGSTCTAVQYDFHILYVENHTLYVHILHFG